jgi:hypothetical protein
MNLGVLESLLAAFERLSKRVGPAFEILSNISPL